MIQIRVCSYYIDAIHVYIIVVDVIGVIGYARITDPVAVALRPTAMGPATATLQIQSDPKLCPSPTPYLALVILALAQAPELLPTAHDHAKGGRGAGDSAVEVLDRLGHEVA